MGQNREAHEGTGVTSGRCARMFPNTSKLRHPRLSKTGQGNENVFGIVCRSIPSLRCPKVRLFPWLLCNSTALDSYPNNPSGLAPSLAVILAVSLPIRPDL